MDAERKPPPPSSSSSQGQKRSRPRRRPRPQTLRPPTVFAIDDIHIAAPPEDPTTTTLLSAAHNNSNTNVGGNELRHQQDQQQVAIQPISTTDDVRLLSSQPQSQLQSNNSTDKSSSKVAMTRTMTNINYNGGVGDDLDSELHKKIKGGGGPRTATRFDEIIANRKQQQQQHQHQHQQEKQIHPSNDGICVSDSPTDMAEFPKKKVIHQAVLLYLQEVKKRDALGLKNIRDFQGDVLFPVLATLPVKYHAEAKKHITMRKIYRRSRTEEKRIYQQIQQPPLDHIVYEQQSQQGGSNRHHPSNGSAATTTTSGGAAAATATAAYACASLPNSTIRKSSSSSSLKATATHTAAQPDDAGTTGGKRSDNSNCSITSSIASSNSTSNSKDERDSIKNQLDESIKSRLEEIEIMRELRNQIERGEQNKQKLPPAVSSDDDDGDDDAREQDNIEGEAATHSGKNNDNEEEIGDNDQEADGIEQDDWIEVDTTQNNSGCKQEGDEDDDDEDDDEQDFDDIATISEERYVMQRLLQNVQASEDTDYFTEIHPSLVTYNTATATATATAITGEGLEESYNVGILSSWNETRIPQQKQKHLRLPWGITSIKNTDITVTTTNGGNDVDDEMKQSNVTEIIEIQRRRIRQTIPKWIPQESGEYLCNETHDLLFTRSQFMLNVVVEVEKQIDGLRNDQTWKVTLSSSKNDDPSDDSYILEAEGTHEALNLLREKTQSFVRAGIERVNLKRLVEDDESLVVDMSLDIAKESMEIRFSTIHVASLGAYIKAIYPISTLARDLGSKGAYEMGCAIIAVNDKEIANSIELEEIVSRAKMRCGDRSRSASILKLTLCLSKYADLSDAPKFSKLNIRRRDGRPYKVDVYKNHRMYRAIELQKSRDNKPDYDVDGDDGEEEEKEADHPKVPVKTKQKRKDLHAQESDERKSKRKKTIGRGVESESDHDTKIDTLDVVNEEATDEIDETTVKNGETEKVQRKANDGIKRFWNFEKKFKPLIDLDYKDTKINVKKSCSSIFSAHKLLFGEDAVCGDDCECFLRLPELCVNVIKEHVAQQKKKGKNVETEQELEGRTRGIFHYFAPRFFPLLNKEYPGETQDQLINRLVDMWHTHTANRMYGVRCIEGCACEGEWEQIFGRGDKAKAKEFTASMKKRSKKRPTSQIDQEKQSKTSTSGVAIPRKKKKAPAATSHALTSIQSERGEKRNTPSSENAHDTNGNKKPKRLATMITNMSTLNREPFEVAFETSTELGGYFRTESLPNGGSRCRIYSKYATGQLAKDLRITNGTSIMSVITGNTVNKISNHSELKQFYDNAKRSRKTLCLVMKNQGVSPASTHNNIDIDSWNKFGIWVNTINDGWAGGGTSKADQYPTTMPRFTHTTESNNTSVSTGKNKPRSISQRSTHDPDLPEWTTFISTSEPGHTKRAPSKPLIRTNETKRKRSKKVVFSMPKNEEFFFLQDEASNVRRVETTTETQTHQMSPQLSTEEMLIDAIQKKSCKDVIEALENGAIRDLNRFESVLKVQYDFVGNELKRIGKLAGRANATKEKNDLNAKYKVLSIYLSTINLTEKTMSLKKWYTIRIELRHIDLERTQNTIDMIGGMVAVKLRNAKDNKEDLGTLPFRKFAQHISYSDSDVDTPLIYTVHNNSNYVLEQRDFVIDLEKGPSPDLFPTGKLGSFNFILNDIEKQCLPDGNSIEYTQALSSSSGELSSGFASITANKRGADKEYITSKKIEVLRKLNTQLDFIERFNKEPTTPPDARLTANIIGIDGKSMLHAAIQLVDDTDLVKRMLRLGADPRISSHNGIGTPLSLAQRNFHRAKDNFLRAQEKDRNIDNATENKKSEEIQKIPTGDIGLQQKRFDKAKLLVVMLQNNVTEHPDVSTTNSHAASSAVIHSRSLDARQGIHSVSGNESIKDISRPSKNGGSCVVIPKRSDTDTSEVMQSSSGNDSSSQPQPQPLVVQVQLCKHWLKSKSCLHYDKGLCKFIHPMNYDIPNKPEQSNNLSRPILPFLKSQAWVIYNRNMRRCKDGNSCRFFKTRSCRFWHDDFSPLKTESLPTIPPCNQLPVLKENVVDFKSMPLGSELWWTTAHIDHSSKTVVYAQNLLKCGYVSEYGTSWFRSKVEALENLRYTVFIRHSQWRPPISQQRGGQHNGRFSHHHQRNEQHYQRNEQHRDHRRHHDHNHHYGRSRK